MSTAPDTPDERLPTTAAVRRALVRRERRADTRRLRVPRRPGTREAVEELARREAPCCPFLDYRVETAGDEVIWTITNPVTGTSARTRWVLDAIFTLPEHAGSGMGGLLGRIADGGVEVVAIDDGFELRSAG